MAKRMTIRLVDELAFAVSSIAKKRGISSNALISEMAWSFVEKWEKLNSPNKKELENKLSNPIIKSQTNRKDVKK